MHCRLFDAENFRQVSPPARDVTCRLPLRPMSSLISRRLISCSERTSGNLPTIPWRHKSSSSTIVTRAHTVRKGFRILSLPDFKLIVGHVKRCKRPPTRMSAGTDNYEKIPASQTSIQYLVVIDFFYTFSLVLRWSRNRLRTIVDSRRFRVTPSTCPST